MEATVTGQGESYVRRHAKASTAAPSTHRRTFGLLIAAVAAIALALGATAASAEAPTVSIDTPTAVSYTSAKVSGTVDPKDIGTSWSFETSSDGGANWSGFNWEEGFAAEGTGPQSVPGGGPRELTGLTPGIEYKVRLTANNSTDPEVFSAVESFTTLPVGPPLISLDAPTAITDSSAHFSGEIDPEAPVGNPSAFDVNWRFECTPECPGLSGTIPADSDPHTVEADATGLKPGTSYEVTLLAENAGGSVSAGPESFATEATPPQLISTKATPLITEATLEATLNPGGLATTYRFDYGPTAAYGKSTPTKSLLAGGDPVTVKAQLFGLTPSSGYHYRLVATNAEGTREGADQGFTTYLDGTPPVDTCPNANIRNEQGSQYLPDCRAFELVSPARKGGVGLGGNSEDLTIGVRVSPDGGRVSYTGWQALPGSAAGSFAGLSATRSDVGWTTTSLLPAPGPNQLGFGFPGVDMTLLATTPDQRVGVFWDMTTVPYGSLRVRRADGSVQTIVSASAFPTCASLHGGGCPNQAWFEGMSADGRHVVFTSTNAYLPGLAPSGNEILYEWVDDGADGGAGTLRVVNRSNSEPLALIDPSSAGLGAMNSSPSTRPRYQSGRRNAVSADGSRIYFQNPVPACEETCGGGELYLRENGTQTTQVSAPNPGHSAASEILYLDAAADGSVAYFWANAQLTDGAPAAGGIYRYEVGTNTLLFVATAERDAFGAYPSLVASEDGRRFLYLDGEQLKAYVNGEVRAMPVVAPLRPLKDDGCPTVNVTPSGSHFAFSAYSEGMYKLFRYDTERDVLDSAAASPDQRPMLGSACADYKAYPRPGLSRAMTDDGKRIVFDTVAALTPEDSNGRLDVYLWQGDRVSLVSPGGSSYGAGSAGLDVSGESLYIATQQALIPQDGDSLGDLYVARVGGGFASPPRAPSCEADACQGSPTPLPSPSFNDGFVGPGNAHVRPIRCAKTRAKARKAKRGLGRSKSGRGGAKARQQLRDLQRQLRGCKQRSNK
ncbi:MAG TPA: fibronectin type III domain-containing protein [Solirubrobacterales bacterium]|nr:fibronectin type III domain-containing protein [Solirubrobacterales bacterium]